MADKEVSEAPEGMGGEGSGAAGSSPGLPPSAPGPRLGEDMAAYVMRPALFGRMVQCLISRDRRGVDKGFFPFYYLYLEAADGQKVGSGIFGLKVPPPRGQAPPLCERGQDFRQSRRCAKGAKAVQLQRQALPFTDLGSFPSRAQWHRPAPSPNQVLPLLEIGPPFSALGHALSGPQTPPLTDPLEVLVPQRTFCAISPPQSWDRLHLSGAKALSSGFSIQSQTRPLSMWPFSRDSLLKGPLLFQKEAIPYSVPASLSPLKHPPSLAAMFQVRLFPILHSQALPGISPSP